MSVFRKTEERAGGSANWEPGWSGGGKVDQATGLVPYFAAIRHIYDYLSTLPIDAFRKDGENRLKAPTPQLIQRLDQPGDIGHQTWVGQWAWATAVDGNAVGWITATDGYGYPTSVRWLNRQHWNFVESTKQWYVHGQPVPAQMIVHSPWIVPAGKTLGISPVEHFREFWKAGLSAQQYADVARGGGIPPAHLKNTAKKLDPDESRNVQRRAVRSFASGEPFVTGNDWALDITTIPPNQAQFLNTLQLTANQTAGIFGIDPREIGGTGAQGSITYVNDESKSLDRANNMRPYMERFEQMTSRILPDRQYIKLNADATIRTDIKTRVEIIGTQMKDGRLSLNEALALEDRPPVAGGDYRNVPGPVAAPATTRTGETP